MNTRFILILIVGLFIPAFLARPLQAQSPKQPAASNSNKAEPAATATHHKTKLSVVKKMRLQEACDTSND